MGKFLHGWRQKAGCVSLLLAYEFGKQFPNFLHPFNCDLFVFFTLLSSYLLLGNPRPGDRAASKPQPPPTNPEPSQLPSG